MKKYLLLTVLSFVALATVHSVSATPTREGIGNEKEKGSMTLHSNRAAGVALLQLTAYKAAPASIVVKNADGKVILEQTAQLQNGLNKVPVEKLLNLEEGQYTVQLTTNKETYTCQFLLWK